MKLSVSMIVKNEEDCLENCLKSVQGAEEIVICDTGSTDGTIEIAKKYTDKVFTDFEWCDDFAKARNHALSKCTGDWNFSIDADHVLLTGIEQLKSAAIKAESMGLRSAFVRAENSHNMAVLFKNTPDILWVGECHEVLNEVTFFHSDAVMQIGKSKSHATDPNRNLRILFKSPKTTRNKFYLARTLWEMGQFEGAIVWMESYLKDDRAWLPERAEAFYVLASSFWNLKLGDKARGACMKAIEINSNFKRAVNLMAEMSWEHNAKTWRKMAEFCTNENLLFI